MKSRRQALSLCLDAVVVVVIEIFNELLFEVIHRLEFLQILVRLFGMEVPVQQIWCDLVDFTF